MSERDFSVQEPTFGPEIRPEVAQECLAAWRGGRPWTQIRVLEGYPVGPNDSCQGSQGEFHVKCSKPIEAVQFTSRFGDPLFFCYDHALKQNDWDAILYDGPKPVYETSSSDPNESVQDTVNRYRKKNKEAEPAEPEEEFDP